MLKTMRKNSTRLIWVVVTIFILFGVGGTIISTTKSRSNVGEVFGKKISNTLFDSTRRMVYFSPRIQNLIQNKQEVTEQLLTDSTYQHLAFQMEAKKRKVKVTDKDVRDEIVRRFTINNKFDNSIYEHWVTRVTGLPLRLYEEGVRKDLLVAKLLESVRAEITVTDDEIKNYYYKQHRAIAVEYVYSPLSSYQDDITYSDDELVTYYQQNIGQFKTDKKYKLHYALFAPSQYESFVTVTEQDLIATFNQMTKFTSDSDTASNPEFESMRTQLTKIVTDQKAKEIAQKEALSFKQSVSSIDTFDALARESNITLQTTKLLNYDSIVKEIGDSSQLRSEIDRMTPRSLSLIETSSGFCVFHIKNVEDPKTIEFKEAREDVITKFKYDQSLNKAQFIFDQAYSDLLEGMKNLKDIESDLNINYQKTDFFTSDESVIFDPKSTFEIYDILWDKEVGFKTRPIVLKNDTIGIYSLINVKDPSQEEFNLAKDGIRKQIREFKEYFEVQQKLSEVLQNANIKKYNKIKDISDR